MSTSRSDGPKPSADAAKPNADAPKPKSTGFGAFLKEAIAVEHARSHELETAKVELPRCARCGAPRETEARTCAYCGSER
jgi:hypothetical protein